LTLCVSGRIAEGVSETVLRRDIATISGSGLSLMPEGMESAVAVEQGPSLFGEIKQEVVDQAA
jgi:hypothetical protein